MDLREGLPKEKRSITAPIKTCLLSERRSFWSECGYAQDDGLLARL